MRPSPVILGAFLVGGLVALWTGMNWALDIRGIATRRGNRATGLDASGNLLARPGYLRVLGAVMALAGVLLIVVTYVLWQLG
ncbi:hypothetical protein [Streptomyces sp. NPDC052225]|uniref:hypothetical protein n=1 Tax=Streptomyces sp. NPDC052225 TaxID=3154949 RepID=UPI003431A03A